MKTLLKILIPLLTTAAIITACQKENLIPKNTTATIHQSIPNEGSTPPILTHRKPMNTSAYTEAIQTLPIDNYQELLKLTANCKDRQNIAKQYKLTLEDLTAATEIADLQRTGMTLIEAAMLQAASNPQDLQTQVEFIGVKDILVSKNQNMDIGLLAHMPPNPFFKVVLNFFENQCSNCEDAPAPSYKRISKWIKIAQQIPVMVSYEEDGKCRKVNQENKFKISTSNSGNEPPLTLTDRKPMRTSAYIDAYELLPIKNDEDLLKLAADCHDREHLADHFNFQLDILAIATEIADLKRTGISTDLATTIHAATDIGLPSRIDTRTELISRANLIRYKHQILDIGLLSKMPPKAFYHMVINFFDNHCSSCQESVRPTFEMIQSAINKAKKLSVRVSYEKDDSCIKVK